MKNKNRFNQGDYDLRPNETCNDYCKRISEIKQENPELTWQDVADIVNYYLGTNFSSDKFRKSYAKNKNGINCQTSKPHRSKNKVSIEPCEFNFNTNFGNNDNFERETISINFDKGETTSCKEIALSNEELKSPIDLLKAHGYDPDEWKLKTAFNNKTMRTTQDGERYYYSSRITIAPKEIKDIGFKEIESYFENFKKKSKKLVGLKVHPSSYDPKGEFLEVCLQDIHMGLLSYEQETGEDYDVDIAKERLNHCLTDVYQRCKGRKFKRIVLVLLGDILHIDNFDLTTTKGTRQDVDTRPTRIFDEALDTLIQVVFNLGKIAPVEIINVQGNHARLSEYCLCKALEMAFKDDPNVTFFNGPNPRKWRRYGKVLIGFAHGDMKPNAVSEWLSNECDEWSQAKFREVHLGHLHSLQTNQKIEDSKYGLIARYLPAICASSAWEHGMGYPKSQRGLISFVWNEETGLREAWYSNI